MGTRRIRTLRVPLDLMEMLALARIRHGRTGAAELAAQDVRQAEADLETRIPESLLAVFASMGEPLSRVVELTDDARAAGLGPRDLAFAEDEGGYWCVLGGRRRGAEVGRWSPGESEPWVDCSLTRYVRRRYNLLDGPTSEEREQLILQAETFRPALVTGARSGAGQRRVRHPKFGEGTVVREFDDGRHKLEIEFSVGRKTILASFVTEASAPRAA